MNGSRLEKAEQRLSSNPYDIEAWGSLVREAYRMPEAEGSQIFERLLQQYPSCGKFWKTFIEYEMSLGNYEKTEKLFQRSLNRVLNLDLWKCYLSYIKESKANLPTFKEKMAQAYDYALDKIGIDLLSFSIWSDYIAFLKSVSATGSYAENQKSLAIRRTYQKGCATPVLNVESLWKDYTNFETNCNASLGKKIIEERTKDFMLARRIAKEYEAITRNIIKNVPAVPPKNTLDERHQMDLWKKYIQWEKDNPLNSEDAAMVAKRVMYAFEQCLLVMGHHPDVWYEACLYLENTSKLLQQKGDAVNAKFFAEEVSSMYERAITGLMKDNHLIYFAYCDYEEIRMKHDKIQDIYEKALGVTTMDPTLTYIQYIKFARRTEGIKASRAIFKRAREDSRSNFHVYVAAALMEYYCSKESAVAYKIFELGLRKYANEPQFIIAYVDFLSHLNEENNTRVLFEKALSTPATEKCMEIWQRYTDFEAICGDLNSLQKVEKRRHQMFLELFEGKETKLMIDRYKYLDLYPVNDSQLRAMSYQVSTLRQRSDVGIFRHSNDHSFYKLATLTPDTSQMIPFKPKRAPHPGSHSIPGGDFPVPPSVALLLRKLPPPSSFQGPFVVLDAFISGLMKMELPDSILNENGILIDDDHSRRLLKRPLLAAEDSDDDEKTVPPTNDIYRARQQKRSLYAN